MNVDDEASLRTKGYLLLPLPSRSKEPPPAGWVKHVGDYAIPWEGNVAIGTRGELAILITNDERSSVWATENFGQPNVRSHRGGHWYFRGRSEEGNESNRETAVGTMELHRSNKYALVPPSIHPSGLPYTWVRELPPLADLPEAPDLRDLWHPGGTHHSELLRMSAAKAHDGLAAEEIATLLIAWRDSHLPDPRAHPDSELRRMASGSYDMIGPGAVTPMIRSSSKFEEGLAEGADEPAALFDEKGKPVLAAFVQVAMREHRFAAVRQSGELRVYENGRYVGQGDVRLQEWIETQFRLRAKTATTRFCSEVVNGVRRRAGVDLERLNPADQLCLANGILNPITREFIPHDPNILFTYRLETAFEPGAKAPAFTDFLETVLPVERDRQNAEEVIGDTLDTTPRQKATAVIVSGSNGKTTFTGVIEDLHGDEAVSNVPLQSLTGKFEAAELYGKRVNISNEMPPKEWADSSAFKALTGGDRIYAQRKFGQPFKFVPTARLIVKANELPPVTDQTYSFARRWNIINFGVTIAEDLQDPDLPAKLRKELPGILNLASMHSLACGHGGTSRSREPPRR